MKNKDQESQHNRPLGTEGEEMESQPGSEKPGSDLVRLPVVPKLGAGPAYLSDPGPSKPERSQLYPGLLCCSHNGWGVPK